jgi:SAM-dependent methyltransferase
VRFSRLDVAPRRIQECLSCGYQRNLEVLSLADAIRIQGHFEFEKPQNESRPTWLSREAVIGRVIGALTTKRQGRILDIGCNSGVFLSTFNTNWEREGVELSNTLSEVARDRLPGCEIHSLPFENLEFEPFTFDVVTSFAVIEHVYDPQSFVREAFRILKQGGLLVLMTGDRGSKMARRYGDDWPLYHSPDHVSYFDADSLLRLVRMAGFEITRVEWRYLNRVESPASTRVLDKIADLISLTEERFHDACYVYATKKLTPRNGSV